jgi:hypothetical protein
MRNISRLERICNIFICIPICGEYLVKDYDLNGDVTTTKYYQLYIYNKAYNPTGDSIWIDNKTGHPTGSNYNYLFKIKAKADTTNLTLMLIRLE